MTAGTTLRRAWRRAGDVWDRIAASDPGLARLRMGGTAAICVASVLGVEYVAARALGEAAFVPMILGAVVAMMSSMGLSQGTAWEKAGTAALVPVAAALGMVVSMAAEESHVLSLAMFVVVMFAAVWVRRFGVRYFVLGFVTWMGFFFVLFLKGTVSQLPGMLSAVVISAAWVLCLRLTVLRDNPKAVLLRMLGAFHVRGRAVARAALVVLAEPDEAQPRRLLRGALVRLTETALVVDGQLGDAAALPAGRSPQRVRGWVAGAELAFNGMAEAVLRLSRVGPALGARTLAAVHALLSAVADDDRASAVRATAALDAERAPAEARTGLRQLADAARTLQELAVRWDSAPTSTRGAEPMPGTTDFEPATMLFAGMLPGTPAAVSTMLERQREGEGRRPLLAGLPLPTRQAVQVAVAGALAIVAGSALSPQRYYWAVIAAFVAFTGTATAGDTINKAAHRVAGTLVGIGAAIIMAHITRGQPAFAVAVILVSLFLGFYLVRVAYGAMIFFITIMLGQLYSILNVFTDAVMVLRLEETAIGAAIGMATSLMLLPTDTRTAVRFGRGEVFSALADLLDGIAAWLRGQAPDGDAVGAARAVDARVQQLSQLTAPMPSLWMSGSEPSLVRRRVAQLAACAAVGRALAALAASLPSPAEAQRVAGAERQDTEVASGQQSAEAASGQQSAEAEGPRLAEAAAHMANACRELVERSHLTSGGRPAALDQAASSLERGGPEDVRRLLARMHAALRRLSEGQLRL